MAQALSRANRNVTSHREFVEFTVDAALLKELGERLVGRPHIALAELVKNAYDADATKVRICFEPDAIEVSDNGDGMTAVEFRKFWMRVGTTHKQDSPITPLFGRQVSGSKGVGRLSVQFLGTNLKLWSVSRGNPRKALRAEVDWRKAQKTHSLVKSGAYLYNCPSRGALPDGYENGTRLRIEGLNQAWNKEDLQGLARELWMLQPPAPLVDKLDQKSNFQIELEGTAEQERLIFNEQLEKAFENWTAEITGELHAGRSGKPAKVTIAFADGETHTQTYSVGNKALDTAEFKIRVYKLSGKQPGGISVAQAREYFNRFGGVHIYDQGFRLPFYGGDGEDWLRLEIDHSHRLIISKLVPESLRGDGDLRDLPTNGRIFGVVRVSTSAERTGAAPEKRTKGEYLNIQVTRDRFIDNTSMNDLRAMVRWALDYYAYLASAKRQRAITFDGAVTPISTEPVIDEIRQRLNDLRSEVPASAANRIEKISSQVDQLHKIEQRREERFRKERILLGALATAGMGAAALEHELGKQLTALDVAIGKINALPKSTALVELKDVLSGLTSRIADARKLLSPLMEPENRDQVAALKAKPLIEGIVSDLKPILRNITIELSGIDPSLRLPPATRAAWFAILQNVIVNAINATIDTKSKRIVISAHLSPSGKRGSLRVEDNGVGVELHEASELFEPFERRLALSEERKRLGLGGVGLGLTIVRMVAQSIEADVNFEIPSDGMSTAFELSWNAGNVTEIAQSTHRRRRA